MGRGGSDAEGGGAGGGVRPRGTGSGRGVQTQRRPRLLTPSGPLASAARRPGSEPRAPRSEPLRRPRGPVDSPQPRPWPPPGSHGLAWPGGRLVPGRVRLGVRGSTPRGPCPHRDQGSDPRAVSTPPSHPEPVRPERTCVVRVTSSGEAARPGRRWGRSHRLVQGLCGTDAPAGHPWALTCRPLVSEPRPLVCQDGDPDVSSAGPAGH